MSPPNASLLLVMVCFWLTFWLVQRFLIRPVWGTLAERQRRMEGAQRDWQVRHDECLAASARLERRLEEAARGAARVRGELRQGALEAREARLAEVRAAAETRLDGAVRTLQVEAAAARAELEPRAVELARQLAGRLLGREVGP